MSGNLQVNIKNIEEVENYLSEMYKFLSENYLFGGSMTGPNNRVLEYYTELNNGHEKFLDKCDVGNAYFEIESQIRQRIVDAIDFWITSIKNAKEKIQTLEQKSKESFQNLSDKGILSVYDTFTKDITNDEFPFWFDITEEKTGKVKRQTKLKKELREYIEKTLKNTRSDVSEEKTESKVPPSNNANPNGVIATGGISTIPVVIASSSSAQNEEPNKTDSKPTTRPNVSTDDTTNPGTISTPTTDQKEPIADNNNSTNNDEIVEKPPVQTPISSNENTAQPATPSQSSYSSQGFGQIFENKDSNFDQTSIATSITETIPNSEVETTLPLDSENPVTNPFGNLFDNEDIVTSNPTYDSDTSKSSGFNPVPLGVGLGLATAGGVGAKILYDHRKNSELESDEDESFGNKFWADDEVGEINSEEENYEDERMDEMLSSTETKENYSASYDAPTTNNDSNWKLDDTDFAANDELSDLLSGN